MQEIDVCSSSSSSWLCTLVVAFHIFQGVQSLPLILQNCLKDISGTCLYEVEGVLDVQDVRMVHETKGSRTVTALLVKKFCIFLLFGEFK